MVARKDFQPLKSRELFIFIEKTLDRDIRIGYISLKSFKQLQEVPNDRGLLLQRQEDGGNQERTEGYPEEWQAGDQGGVPPLRDQGLQDR